MRACAHPLQYSLICKIVWEFQFEMLNYIDVEPNSVSVWEQFPQYVIITVGETLFAVTGLSFAYSQVSHITGLVLSLIC